MQTNTIQNRPIAIVGMSGMFAGAENVDAFWENIVAQTDCITEVPPSRWDLADYYDPDPKAPDKTYSKVGGFIPDIDFDPLTYGLPPNILEVTDSSQILSLVVAKQALQHARYEGERFSETVRQNTGVILGVGGGQKLMGPLSNRLQGPIWRKVLAQYGLSEEATEEAIEKMKAAYVSWQENAFPGFLGNVVAGRIANRFDLGGTNCTVDAACAASLAAIKMAVTELIEHRCDMMISGGVDTDNSPMAYLSFSKTPAFSQKNRVRPFDADADGIVIGEGVGMLVMKRLADAERDGDTIYAVIKGIGSSSDGRHSSIYAPVSEGQQLAMQRAYREAGYAPTTVGLLEAHGTGTPTGDRVEFHSIASVFEGEGAQKIALGSVKSQIGHTKTAAGAASLIKTSLALHHKVLPPTINVQQPHPSFNIAASPVYINTQLRPWIPATPDTPRRAGVSAFGFGGTNFHLTVEEYQAEHQAPYRRWSPYRTALLHADTPAALRQRCQQLLDQVQKSEVFESLPVPESVPSAAPRLGFVYQNRDELITRLTTAQQLMQNSDGQPREHPQGISYRPQDVASDQVAVLFSGQGAQYVNMGSQLACLYPEFRTSFQQADRVMQQLYHETLSDKVYPVPAWDEAGREEQQRTLTQTQYAQPAIGTLSMSLYRLLTRAGLRPAMVGGHSFGELTALWAAGVLAEEDYLSLACLRGRVMAQASRGQDAGGMLAVQTDADTARRILREASLSLDVANINAPNQVVLGGATAEVERAADVFSSHRLHAKVLPVSAAFHTQRLQEAQQPLAEAVAGTRFQSPQCAVFSNIDGQAYPADGAAIQQKFKEHMLSTVQFQQQIEAMYEAGARVFVEVGPRNILSNLVGSILGERPHQVIALNANPKQDSARLYQQALTQLRVAGVAVDTQDPYRLPPLSATEAPAKMKVRVNASNYVSENTRQQQEQLFKPSAETSQPNEVSTLNKSSNQLMVPHPHPHPVNGQALPPVPEEAPASPPVANEPTHLSLEIIRKQIGLMDEMVQFQVQQQNVLEQHRAFLKRYEKQMNQMLNEKQENPQEAIPAAAPLPVVPPSNGQATPNGHASPNGKAPTLAASAEVREAALAPPSQSTPDAIVVSEADVIALIADKTGYPAEMLSLDMELVADLGIDSIKQVEIFGAMREQHPVLQQWETEDFMEIKTLGDIIAKVNGSVSAPAEPTLPPTVADEPSMESPAEAAPPAPEGAISAEGSSTDTDSTTAPAPAEPTEDLTAEAVADTLLTVIANKTGYPAEMLSLDMELVADLGIDSIKQVEIMGALREQYPSLHDLEAEQLLALTTISDVMNLIESGAKKKSNRPLILS